MSTGFRSSQVYEMEDNEPNGDHLRYDRQADEYTQDEHTQQQPPPSRRTPTIQSGTPANRRPGSSGGRRTPSIGTSQSSSSGTSATSLTTSQRHGRGSSTIDQDMAKNFKVVVRIRPPLPRELESMRGPNGVSMYRDIVRTEDRNRGISICENGIQSKDGFNTTTTTNADGTLTQSTSTGSGIYATHKFTFDYVYDQDAQQVDVYNNTAREAVLSTLQGYNATILAYGQTGTGKTFSMEGFESSDLRGIIPRSVEEIFNYIQNTAHTNVRFLVRASYLQIYNEVISDLLKPERSNLAIREDRKKGVFVEGLSEWVVRSPKEVYGLIKRGTSLRATGSTRINETSSRSHALFIIIVEQNEMIYEEDSTAPTHATPGMDQQEKARTVAGSNTLIRQSFKVGKLNLVDLAGSERVRISGAKGRRLEESKYINQSLSALGNVISALTEGGRSHVPYRDSKLTRILEDSFGGNVRCTLLAMVSPSQEAFLESLSTLKFANRAKNIQNEAKINEDLDEKALLRRYERELKKLRQELLAKSKNVVDKRKLIEVEEQRRRAEQDKMTALMNMERLSRDLLTEKNQKKKLEERIKEMNSQLLVGGLSGGVAVGGGTGSAATGGATGTDPASQVESQKAFQQALQFEQDRIRAQYSEKLQELEKEREQMEEEKAQTSRYKQLLLKQRDIMIQLTARLNERDQSILLLQEELDAYDKHQRAMEDELDQKRHRLIQLQRMNVGSDGGGAADPSGLQQGGIPMDPSSPSSGGQHAGGGGGGQQGQNLYGLFPIDEAPYFEEHSLSPMHSPPSGRTGSASSGENGTQQQPPRSASPPLPSSQAAAFSQEQFESEVNRRVMQELAARQSSSASSATGSIPPQVQQQVLDLSDALRAKESETLRLREELERLRRQPPPTSSSGSSSQEVSQLQQALKSQDEYAHSLVAQNHALQQSVQALQTRLASSGTGTASGPEDQSLRDSLSNLKKKYDVQLQERAALKVILEKKMKALIDSIATAAFGKGTNIAGSPTKDAAGNPTSSAATQSLPSRTKREIEVLQRLVEASLTALKNSDVDGSEGSPATLQSSPPSTSTSSLATRSFTPSASPTIPQSSIQQQRPTRSPEPPSASSLDGIELLIQQRKAELLRMDERMR